MKHRLTILLILIGLSGLVVIKGCKKDTPPPPAPTEEEQLEEELTSDASYNDDILPGAGNFFVNSDLRSNQPVQHVGSLSLSGDSLALLGATDAGGKVAVVHSAGLIRGSGRSGALAQVQPEEGRVFISALSGSDRANPVLVVRPVSESGMELSLREYKPDHTFTTVAGAYYENGERIAGVLLMEANPSHTAPGGCPLPSAASGGYGNLSDVGYLRCKLQHSLTAAESFLSDYVSEGGVYGDAVGSLQQGATELLATLDKLERLSELRTHEQSLGNKYGALVDAYRETAMDGRGSVTGLTLAPEAPAYSERDGKPLLFNVVVATDGDGTTDEPVYVNVRLANADGSAVYLDEVRAIDTGATEIRFDPKTMEDYGTAESLVFSYGLVSDGTLEEVTIPLHYVVPDKIAVKSGNNQEVKMLQDLPELLTVSVTATDGLPVEGVKVVWEVTKGGGVFGGAALASVEATTDENGIAQAPYQWTLGRKGPQEVKATAYHQEEAIDETLFTATVYQPKRELVYFTGLDDHQGVPLEERTPVRTVEEGGRFEAYHNVAYAFRVKEDGKFVHLDGREILTAFTDGRGAWVPRAGDSFLLEDYEISYINGQGFMDTIRFDVVVKNTLYDMVVGRTLKQTFLNGNITYYQFNKGGSVTIYNNHNTQTDAKTYVMTIDEPTGQRGNLYADAYTLWFCEEYTYHEPNIGVVYIGAERGKGMSDYDLRAFITRLYVNENGKLSFNDAVSRSCVDYILGWVE